MESEGLTLWIRVGFVGVGFIRVLGLGYREGEEKVKVEVRVRSLVGFRVGVWLYVGRVAQ